MNPVLRESYERLQRDTRAILKEVSSLSSATYHHKPAEDKWSISQILTHLMTSERLSLSYMKKKSLGVDNLSNSGFMETLKFFLLRLSQRLPFLKFKAPRVVLEQTPAPLSYGDLVRQWEAVRAELRDFLQAIPEEHIRKKIYKHPKAGMLDANHAIRFLAEHLHHHHPQIVTIISDQKKHKLEQH